MRKIKSKSTKALITQNPMVFYDLPEHQEILPMVRSVTERNLVIFRSSAPSETAFSHIGNRRKKRSSKSWMDKSTFLCETRSKLEQLEKEFDIVYKWN